MNRTRVPDTILLLCLLATQPGCQADQPPAPAMTGRETESHSEHVDLTPEAIRASGIQVLAAGAGPIRVTLQLPGEIAPNADALAHIVPRFPGIARRIDKRLGDTVRQGEVLAVVESNESLSPYEVRSLLSGSVIERHITLGEFVRDDQDIFVVADLATVWANLIVYPRDLERVRPGQQVILRGVAGTPEAQAEIDYIGPVLGEPARSATARVVLRNPVRVWRPGMFVTAEVVLDQRRVEVAIVAAAVQQLEGRTVVFVHAGGHFEPRDVEIGPGDGEWIEVRSGLEAGERYVAAGAFILKSELLKSKSGHGH